MSDKKKNSRFVTSILIGGALGSMAALLFGRRKRKKTITEKIEDVLRTPKPECKKEGFFGRLLGRCRKKE